VAKKSSASSAALDPDLEWFGMGEEEALPPKAGRSKRSTKPKKPAKKPGVHVAGQEVHPALAIAFFAGVFLLTGYVIYSKLTNVTIVDDDIALIAPAATPPPQKQNSGQSKNNKNNNNRGKNKGQRQGQKKPNKPGQSSKSQGENEPDASEPVLVAKATTDKPPEAKSEVPELTPPNSVQVGANRYETIPFEPSAGFTVGVSTCPVVISGNRVWDKANKAVQEQLDGSYVRQAQTAVSPDGRLFAATSRPADQQDSAVTVWDTQTGKKLFTANGDSKRFVDVLLLSSKSLMLGDRWSDELLVWNCDDGKRRKSIKVPNVRFKQGNAAVSDDGKYVAMVAAGQLGVVDASDGKTVAIMHPPDPKVRVKRVSLKAGDKPKGSRRPDEAASEPIFAALQSLRFSPDNSELAGLSTHPRARMMSWNGMGDLNVDQAVSAQSSALQEGAFQWFANRDAWLVAGNILDRKTGRIVVTTKRANTAHASVHVYDDEHMVGVFASAPADLSIVTLPWEAISDGLNEMQNTDAVALGVGTEVSVQVDLKPVLNPSSEPVKSVRNALRTVVSREDLKIEENRPTVFRIRIATTAEEKTPLHDRQTPADYRSGSAGSGAVPNGDCVVVELIVPGEEQPVWRENLGSLAELGLQSNSSGGKAEKLKALIDELALPYYIPKDEQTLALPVVIN